MRETIVIYCYYYIARSFFTRTHTYTHINSEKGRVRGKQIIMRMVPCVIYSDCVFEKNRSLITATTVMME